MKFDLSIGVLLMSIKKILFSIILLSGLFCSSLHCQESSPQSKTEAELPNPMKLNTNWWEYFDVKGEEYKNRTVKLKEELDGILAGLENEQKDQAVILIKRLSDNMDAYALAKQEAVEEPSPRPFLDSYTLQQQIEVAKQIALHRSQLNSEKQEAGFLKNRLSKLSRHLDSLVISYREMKDDTFQKMLQGLEILNTRFTIAINKERLGIVNDKVKILTGQLNRSINELEYARNNIDFDAIDLPEMENQLAEAKEQLEQARQNSLQTELKAQPITEDTVVGRLKNSLQLLREYNSSIKELMAELAVLMQQVKVGIGTPERDLTEMEKDYSDWTKQVSGIYSRIDDWEMKIEEESARYRGVVEDEPTMDSEIEQLQSERAKVLQENRLLLQQADSKAFTVGVILEQFGQIVHSQRSPLSRWWQGTVESIIHCCYEIIAWYNLPLFKIGEQPITVKNIVKAIIVLILTYFFSYFMRKFLSNAFRKKSNVSHGFVYSINRLVHYVILVIGLVIAMTVMGLDFDRMFIVLGALSVGIGFGLQSIVNNFVCGLIILSTRNIKVGDYIEMSDGQWGSVSAIHVQNTIIRTWDGTDIVLPNSTLVSERYINWTRLDPYKRFHIPFCVPFGTDKEKIEEAAIKAALNVPATVGKEQGVHDPQCWLVNFAENGLQFELVVWTNVFRGGNHGSVKGSYYWELESAIKEYGIRIPYPQREIHVEKTDNGKSMD